MENSPEIRNLWALEVSPGVRAPSQKISFVSQTLRATAGSLLYYVLDHTITSAKFYNTDIVVLL